jgi:hypothetical protein
MRALAFTLLLAALGCEMPNLAPIVAAVPLAAQTELDADERAALANGIRVSHATRFERDGGKYIAAVSYVVATGRAEDLLATATDVKTLHDWLPFNVRTDIVGHDGDTTIVEMAQGFEPFVAVYSLRVKREGSVIRWQLDHDRPADIRDAWGFIHVRPYDERRSLLVVGLAIDLGDGIIRNVLENEIHRMLMWAVDDARSFLEGRAWREDDRACFR